MNMDMDMDMGVDHDMSAISSSSFMSMAMVFNNNHNTPLFSNAWTPSSQGTYAGTCIFLVALAIIGRCLVAFKALMEQRWISNHLNRRSITVASKTPEAGRVEAEDPNVKIACLVAASGVEETVKVVRRVIQEPLPWRFSVDLPRALLFLCITGVSYLLMLAVMTMNVGYFCSVLGGVFLGELVVGRYIQWNEHDH